MNTTKILGEAVGIQRSGLKDRTETNAVNQLSGILVVGEFKSGRIDKPMTIHQGNIEAELGYDPDNPSYIAVREILDLEVPFVQVLRVKPSPLVPEVTQPIGCDGAIPTVGFVVEGVWNGVGGSEYPEEIRYAVRFTRTDTGEVLGAVSYQYTEKSLSEVWAELINGLPDGYHIIEQGWDKVFSHDFDATIPFKVEFIRGNEFFPATQQEPLNPTFESVDKVVESDDFFGSGTVTEVTFCLAPTP